MKIRKKDGTFKEIIYNESQLYKYGINRLSEREFGYKELQTKMKRLQPDVAMVDAVLDKLKGQGYLSDERRARSLINQFIKKEGMGKIKQRLALKGIGSDLISEMLKAKKDEMEEEGECEEEKALQLLVKKFKEYEYDNQPKMYRFLASRGFETSEIQKGIKMFQKVEIE